MKHLISLMVFIVLIIGTSGCKKDQKEEALDPCANIVCLNGGSCANGSCNCTDRYTGSDCSLQVTPSRIRINKVVVTRFPATDGGAGWDLTSGPDIFIRMLKGTSTVWDSPSYFENADPNLDYTFDFSPGLNLTDVTAQYSLLLYDYDVSSADDFMGGISFTPYHSTNGFPAVLSLDAGGEVSFQVYVSYIFN